MLELPALEDALRAQLAAKPKRLAHSLGVADAARDLARTYKVDEESAYLAGLLHDWGKAYSAEETMRRARKLGIDMGVELELVWPLLHGPIAARELADIFPEISHEVLQAIERHTIGATDMGPLDMVIFVADAIEPGRPSTPSIEDLRSKVGEVDLDELFWLAFKGSISYVIQTDRYLYPATLDIYNELALRRSNKEHE